MVIEINPLSTKSIEAAIKQIEDYRNSLEGKCQELIQRLAEIGVEVIETNITSAQTDDSSKTHKIDKDTNNTKGHAELVLKVKGEDLVFIEFGAGVHFNGPVGTAVSPVGEELGFTIGSYSDYGPGGKSFGQFDMWYYRGPDGEEKYTHGTEGTAPVYNASLEMRRKIIEIAEEVFGKGR